MKTKKIDLIERNALKVCPACGYNDGFHVMFKKAKGNTFEIKLICPSCHKLFSIGWEK
jgi:uncharacterized protein YbaR (Trm112 family)